MYIVGCCLLRYLAFVFAVPYDNPIGIALSPPPFIVATLLTLISPSSLCPARANDLFRCTLADPNSWQADRQESRAGGGTRHLSVEQASAVKPELAMSFALGVVGSDSSELASIES